MKSKKCIAAMWLLALLPLLLMAVFYARLPDRVPMHWGFDGEIDRYGSKNELWLIGALGPLFALLFQFLPRLDPKKRNYEKFHTCYEAFALVLVAFITVMMGVALLESFRPGTVFVGRVVSALVGSLFVFIGNLMGKVKPNFFLGIRTPLDPLGPGCVEPDPPAGRRPLFPGGAGDGGFRLPPAGTGHLLGADGPAYWPPP